MPAREINLTAGASGAGKSHFSFQLSEAIRLGGSFFGYPCVRASTLYVCCDRGEDSFRRTLDTYGVAHDAFPWVSEANIPGLPGGHSRPWQVLRWAKEKFPEAHLITLDGFSGLVANVSDYAEVRKMLREVQALLRSQNQTLHGTTHATKIKTLDQILNPRERVLGSVAWGGGAEMVVSLDSEDPKDPRCPYRVANFCNHSGAGFRLRLTFGPDGRLDLASEEETLLDLWDRALPERFGEGGWSRGDIQAGAEELCPDGGASLRTVDRWIARAVESARIRRKGSTTAVRFYKVVPS